MRLSTKEKLEGSSREGTGIRPKGKKRVEQIIAAARKILVTQGPQSLTMRNVAALVGNMNLGNLYYYFPTKESLIKSLIHDIHDSYAEKYDKQAASLDDPKELFLAELELQFDDISDKETRQLFINLWALMESESPTTKSMLQDMYQVAQERHYKLIREINPDVSSAVARDRAAIITSLLEGLMVVLGDDVEDPKRAKRLRQEVRKLALHFIEI